MTLMFPEQEAQTVIKWAREAGETTVETLINEIRDWLGHPEVVKDRVDAWSDHAKGAIDDAKESIIVCKGELAAYWEGPAYDSFSIYMDSLTEVFDQAEQVMAEMGQLMLDARAQVTETYKEAIGIIGNTAAAIIEAVGGAIEQAIRIWLSVLSAVLQILAEFTRQVTAATQKAMGIITEFTAIGMRLKMKATDLEVPSTMPPSAGIPDNWDVRSQT